MKTRKARAPRVPGKWEPYFRALTQLRLRLVARETVQNADLRGGIRSPDPGDTAETIEENDDLLAAIRHEDAEVSEIDAALARIANGTYGICEATGRKIPPARLRAIPWARFVREAAEAREQGRASAG